VIDLDDWATLGAASPILSRGVIYGGGMCAGQNKSSSGTAKRLWINNRGLDRPSQAIPQRFYTFTMESFVAAAFQRKIPLNDA
jgi:hypothetical protein